MVDIPTHVNIGKRNIEDSYIQILGLSQEKPIVKVNNQLFAGEIVHSLGSDLLFEIESIASGNLS